MKNEGLPIAFEKLQYVMTAYNNTGHRLISFSLTQQRSPQRILLSIAACDMSQDLFCCNITQSYPQSKTNLARPVYAKPSHALSVAKESVIRLKHLLY